MSEISLFSLKDILKRDFPLQGDTGLSWCIRKLQHEAENKMNQTSLLLDLRSKNWKEIL